MENNTWARWGGGLKPATVGGKRSSDGGEDGMGIGMLDGDAGVMRDGGDGETLVEGDGGEGRKEGEVTVLAGGGDRGGILLLR